MELHGEGGLHYDTSVGFNDAAGYRLGIGFPFHPWNPFTGQAVAPLQIPTVLMDGNLLYDPAISVEDALIAVERVLSELKRSEATAAIDWHVRTSYPGRPSFARWAAVYRGLLEMLDTDQAIEVLTPAELFLERHPP